MSDKCCDDDKASPKRSPTGRNIESDGATTHQVVLAGTGQPEPGGLPIPRTVGVDASGHLLVRMTGSFLTAQAAISSLEGGATLADVITTVNSILTTMRAQGVIASA